jgi:arsenite methyltransferase
MDKTDDVRSWVKNYYGEVLASSNDLQTNACCATGAPPAFLKEALARVDDEVKARFYGCGFPIPEALAGCRVVDFGSGSGRDVYLLSQLVGQDGFVHGVDMTDSQLELARRHIDGHMQRFGYDKPNVAFHQGYIEDLEALDIPAGSIDVVVSNCVINLSPRKDLVLKQVHRLLKTGGELYFSDVFVDRRLPDEIAFDPQLHSECLGGAMYLADFMSLAKRTGFLDPRQLEIAPITIQNPEIERKVGAARFYSVTLRLFKLDGLDDQCEDYGQIASYRGSIDSSGPLYWLDDHHLFEAGRPERVCGNTAAMLQKTRLAPHFEILGDQKTHYGVFPCGPTLAASERPNQRQKDNADACSTGSCC